MARERDEQTAAPAVAMSPEQFAALLAAVKQSGTTEHADRLEQILLKTAEVSAQTMKRALKPENDQHPGISVMSYPEGDVKRPRDGILKHEFYWNGFPVHKFPESHHWYELELFAQIQPGEYHVLRTDFSPAKISAHGEKDANGKLTKLEIRAVMSREESRLAAPMAVWAYQMLHQDQDPIESYMRGVDLHIKYVVKQQPPESAVA